VPLSIRQVIEVRKALQNKASFYATSSCLTVKNWPRSAKICARNHRSLEPLRTVHESWWPSAGPNLAARTVLRAIPLWANDERLPINAKLLAVHRWLRVTLLSSTNNNAPGRRTPFNFTAGTDFKPFLASQGRQAVI